jgi:PAS domain S-box-containing protein
MNKLRDYLVNEVRKLSIAYKIHTIVAALAILTTLLVAMGIQSVRLQTVYRNELATSATAALNIERVNGIIYAIVMESRAIYYATEPDKLKYFCGELLRRNRDLGGAVEGWETTLHPDDIEKFALFKKRITQFIDFRSELVRRATEVSVAAGREWGVNDANLKLRSALNTDLEAFGKIYVERASHVVDLADQTRLASWYLAALGIGALLLAALNVFVMRTHVIQPLSEITQVTDSIATGNFELGIPFITRTDEMGRLAHAVQNFRDIMIQNVKLQEREAVTAKSRDAAIGQRDILDHKYHAAKWQLSVAVNNMAHGLVMLDSAANAVVMNDQLRKMYQLPSDINVGNSLKDILRCTADNGLFTGDVTTYIAQVLARIAKNAPSTHEMELSDGRIIRISSRPMNGGGWVSTHVDCTAERRMQRALEQTERFLVTVIENVPEAIAAKDARSLRYVFVNRAAEKLFSLPRAQIIGKTARELFSPDMADMVERGDRRLLDGGEQLEATVHNVETPNGRRVHAVRRIPVRGPDGESRVFLSMIEDRTDWAKQGVGVTVAV